MYRVGICCVAVGLLWLTTLQMSTSIADAHFKSVGLNKVVSEWEKSVSVIVMEEKAYELCADREIYECNQDFNESLVVLDDQLKQQYVANQLLVIAVNDLATSCATTYADLAGSLSEYSRQFSTLKYSSTCTAQEVQDTQTLIGDASQAREYAYSMSKDYTRSTADIMASAEESVGNYTQYNYDYITNLAPAAISANLHDITSISFGNIDQFRDAMVPVTNAFGEFLDCTFGKKCTAGQSPHVDGCCPVTTVAQAFDTMVDGLEDAWEDTADALTQNRDDIKDAFDEALARFTQAADWIDGIRAYWNDFKTQVPAYHGPDIPNFVPIPGVSVSTPSPPGSLTGLGTYFDGVADLYTANMTAKITETAGEVVDDATAWADQINVTANVEVLPPYNPPPVELGGDELEANTQLFLSQQAVAMNQIYTAPASDSNITAESIKAYFESNVVAPSSINITVSSFSTKDYSFYNFLDVFANIGIGCIALDYAWRIYSSLHLIVKYWSASAVGLPFVDVRQFKTTQKTPAAVRLARILTNPMVLYTIILVACAAALALTLGVYMPIYHDFQNGCVKTHDGTLLSKNTNAFAYNWASLAGAQNIADGLKDYDSRRNAECAGHTNGAQNDYNTFVDQWNGAEANHADAKAKVDLIAKCVIFDLSSITYGPGIFEEQIKDTNGIPLPHPTTLMAASQCAVLPEPVHSMAFNCSTSLPACNVGCGGPSELLIQYTTHQSACASEDLIHSYLLKLITGVVIYICLNVSRLAFMKGLSLMFWRSVTPFGFTFLGSCSRTGKMTVNAKTLLQAETAVTISKFKIKAMGIFIFAGLIHLPWLMMLIELS